MAKRDPFKKSPEAKIYPCGKIWSAGIIGTHKVGDRWVGHQCPYPFGHAGTCVCRCGAPAPVELPLEVESIGALRTVAPLGVNP